uniref:Translin-associated factor X-interacting protein 1 N-terminal domain-containing protein n=1 Tax=Eutreptiella gymnastica TaxID=73025 RepID=A0A7S1NNG2_9EUGL|mmetsp:Transcript_62551/g.111473  ORF Transcript_62551/g.111473 Transcript_62551/m.111473 type:complete len:732 (+) Transcript_62551:111-2306(+)
MPGLHQAAKMEPNRSSVSSSASSGVQPPRWMRSPEYSSDELPLVLGDVFYQNLSRIVQGTVKKLKKGAQLLPYDGESATELKAPTLFGAKQSWEPVTTDQQPDPESAEAHLSPDLGAKPHGEGSGPSQTSPLRAGDLHRPEAQEAQQQLTAYNLRRLEAERLKILEASAVLSSEREALEKAQETYNILSALGIQFAAASSRVERHSPGTPEYEQARVRFEKVAFDTLHQLSQHYLPDATAAPSEDSQDIAPPPIETSDACTQTGPVRCADCGSQRTRRVPQPTSQPKGKRAPDGVPRAAVRLQAAYAFDGPPDAASTRVSTWPSNVTTNTMHAMEPQLDDGLSSAKYVYPLSTTSPLDGLLQTPTSKTSLWNGWTAAERSKTLDSLHSTFQKWFDASDEMEVRTHGMPPPVADGTVLEDMPVGDNTWSSTSSSGPMVGELQVRPHPKTAVRPPLLVHMEDFVKQFAPLVKRTDPGYYEKRWLVYRQCFEIFIRATPTYCNMLKRILDESDLLMHHYKEALSKPQQLVGIIQSLEASHAESVSQLQGELKAAQVQLKNVMRMHDVDKKAWQESLADRDASIRTLKMLAEREEIVPGLEDHPDWDEQRIRRMFVAKTRQHKQTMEKVQALESQAETLKAELEIHTLREQQMAAEWNSVLAEMETFKRVEEKANEDLKESKVRNGRLAEECAELKARLQRLQRTTPAHSTAPYGAHRGAYNAHGAGSWPRTSIR